MRALNMPQKNSKSTQSIPFILKVGKRLVEIFGLRNTLHLYLRSFFLSLHIKDSVKSVIMVRMLSVNEFSNEDT